MDIGNTLRKVRLQRGLSQGDIEKSTGLLRCYLSRVENGHTVPSLETLSKIASAMKVPLAQFFADGVTADGQPESPNPMLSDEDLKFLSHLRRYSAGLDGNDRKLVLIMVKKMAAK